MGIRALCLLESCEQGPGKGADKEALGLSKASRHRSGDTNDIGALVLTVCYRRYWQAAQAHAS